ncbi:MAG: tyrosine-type recombinase/integrase [Planctomycetota bacterium]
MPDLSKTNRLPKFALHKASGQARVCLGGRDIYLGPYDLLATREKYDRLIAEYLAAGRNVDLMPSVSRRDRFCVIDLIAAFKDHAEAYYVKDGEPTKTIANLRIACRRLRELYGSLPVEEFGPAQLRAVRETWINDGNNERTVNYKTTWIKHVFRWGVEQELVSGETWHRLEAVRSLKKGRSRAKPSNVRGPVPREHVDRTLECLPPIVADMVRVQLLTCCRSGELCSLTWDQIDTSEEIWFYTPRRHKTQHHGRPKLIAIGGRAQAVLESYRDRAPDAPIFSPSQSERIRNGLRRSEGMRLTIGRAAAEVGEAYTPDSYRRAVTRAAKQAGVPHWHPHQLRHLGATELCREVGIETAAAALGNTLEAAQIYADASRDLARRAATVRG